MVSGKKLVIAILLLGAALILGYDLVRRASIPESAALVEDRGRAAGSFDRVYRFREERYLLREEPRAERGASAILLARIDEKGERRDSVTHPIAGSLADAHFLELERGGAPTVVAIVREEGETERAAAIAFRLGGGGWIATPLPPLPEEIGRRYTGHDHYERQGAFLYRRIELAPKSPEEEPATARLFYDFENQRWVLTQ